MNEQAGVTLVTGFPSRYLAVRVVEKLLADDPALEVRCVVPPEEITRAASVIEKLPERDRARLRLYEGRVPSMDMGLSGAEYRELAKEVRVVHHCGGVARVSIAKRLAEQENVAGMREVLELAEAASHLERVVHWSSATVSGARRGYVLEEELSDRDGFHNELERTQLAAERLLRRAGDRVPSIVLRPTTVVGDSATGEIDTFEGPYLLVLLMLGSEGELQLPMPGRGDAPLNVVPIDYVVAAGMRIAQHPKALGRIFHIVDPDPLTARRVIELIADATGRPVPRAFVPGQVATTLLKTPGLSEFSHVPRAFLDQLRTEVVYDDRNARELLSGSGIRCPGFEDYVDVMVRYVRDQQDEIRARSDALSPDADDS